jgi:uncharacterized PurR-regulated membrane protein YhhQ (DUF165 family)
VTARRPTVGDHHIAGTRMPYLIAFIATIFLANWAIETYGLVPVGPDLVAPAGVYFAGLAFTFRDLAHDRLGRGWIVLAIVAGAVLSGLVSSKFALASGVAFLVSELLDFAVYTPLRNRNWLGAVAASNVVGLVADSILFLWLAFGSLSYLFGQIVGKAWMTLLAVAVLWALRRRLAPSAGPSAGQ